jgi:hypothetical protein
LVEQTLIFEILNTAKRRMAEDEATAFIEAFNRAKPVLAAYAQCESAADLKVSKILTTTASMLFPVGGWRWKDAAAMQRSRPSSPSLLTVWLVDAQ